MPIKPPENININKNLSMNNTKKKIFARLESNNYTLTILFVKKKFLIATYQSCKNK